MTPRRLTQPIFGKDAVATILACDGGLFQRTVFGLCTCFPRANFGASLFRTTAISASLVDFEKELTEAIPALLTEPLSEARFAESLRKLQILVDGYLERGLPQVSREVSLPYMRFQVTVVCKDFMWEAQLRLWAALKAKGDRMQGWLTCFASRGVVHDGGWCMHS